MTTDWIYDEMQLSPKELLTKASTKCYRALRKAGKMPGSVKGIPLEEPVARAVESLATFGNDTRTSGFMRCFSKEVMGIGPAWAIVIQGKVDREVVNAVNKAGLKLNERDELTDVYLPDVPQEEEKKAQAIFDKFAFFYYAATLKKFGFDIEKAGHEKERDDLLNKKRN